MDARILRTITKEVAAGDPFAYAGSKRRGCFACYEGVVYLGRLVEEDGEEVEVVEAVPCIRCNGDL